MICSSQRNRLKLGRLNFVGEINPAEEMYSVEEMNLAGEIYSVEEICPAGEENFVWFL